MNPRPFPTYGDPQQHPDNLGNPYGYQVQDESQGLTYYNSVDPNSTMVSDSVQMTERLKMFVPSSSVKKGRAPGETLMSAEMLNEEENRGNNYKSKFQ